MSLGPETTTCSKCLTAVAINCPNCDLKAPLPELDGSYPIVLYFETQSDRDEFMAIIHEAKPGLVAKKL